VWRHEDRACVKYKVQIESAVKNPLLANKCKHECAIACAVKAHVTAAIWPSISLLMMLTSSTQTVLIARNSADSLQSMAHHYINSYSRMDSMLIASMELRRLPVYLEFSPQLYLRRAHSVGPYCTSVCLSIRPSRYGWYNSNKNRHISNQTEVQIWLDFCDTIRYKSSTWTAKLNPAN